MARAMSAVGMRLNWVRVEIALLVGAFIMAA